jgi:hypothetical protein
MAKKKISDEQIAEMKKMVAAGTTPEDISKHFNIGISSVHNYKRMLKKEGLEVPDVRGKRPSNIKKSYVQTFTQPSDHVSQEGSIKVTINNTLFVISSRAKSVVIGHDSLDVSF